MATSITTTSGANHLTLEPNPTQQHQQRTSTLSNVRPFLIGGLSGMLATTCVQPLDMIKVRLQLSDQGTKHTVKPSSLTVARAILSQGRISDFYQGLTAALARQIVYGTCRLGFFVTFEDALKTRAENNKTTYGFPQRAFASVCAGGLAAAIGNPTEVALIRMQSDGLRPIGQREGFRSVFDAVIRITRSEGLFALWGGCAPTVIRAIATNFGQLAFFSESKHQLRAHTNWSEQAQTLTASAIGGFCAAFFSMPFDFVKSRLQSQQNVQGSRGKYNGMIDCIAKVVREEGLLRFYRGFPAYFSRMAPHSVISLVIMDKLASIFK
ncbi:mitochondrial carrier domain-containing protein [Exophiala viscosa]|uniref:mitochondrial carrier domain-containing protein n=1 Tax=Exophiala viscosa TaxID=2486360 RepID=UPI002194F1C5|nr:mitochondrial carrier domain-containing protein [Exophiala viscosa]